MTMRGTHGCAPAHPISLFPRLSSTLRAVMSERLAKPASGTRIGFENGHIVVPDDPIIPYIEGDGTGPDIWRATRYVIDGTVGKVYDGKRSDRKSVV